MNQPDDQYYDPLFGDLLYGSCRESFLRMQASSVKCLNERESTQTSNMSNNTYQTTKVRKRRVKKQHTRRKSPPMDIGTIFATA